MPTQAELEARERFDLINAVAKFGGISAVAGKFGWSTKGQRFPKRWATIEDLHPHLDPLVTTLGRMPKARELRNRCREDLVNAIRGFGGFTVVAKHLGYRQEVYHSWPSVEALRPHLDPVVMRLAECHVDPI